MKFDHQNNGYNLYNYESMLLDMLEMAHKVKASDLHIVVGSVPVVRFMAEIMPLANFPVMTPGITEGIVKCIMKQQLYLADDAYDKAEVDMAFSHEKFGRYRVNTYKQKGSYAVAIRVLPTEVKSFASLGLPAVIKQFAYKNNGLMLVTGPTGSGKSTTLAALLDLINKTRRCHIITIEDPIEYIYDHGISLISQREVGRDTASFAAALRSSLREDPDVILVGEMRDPETISIALTAAETGHLVLSTLHTIGVAKTVDRIVDAFSSEKQIQIRSQLASVLRGVVSQILVPKKNTSGVVLATEIMITNSAISNLIREGKTHQIANVLQTSKDSGMHSLDFELERLVKSDVISYEEAILRCQNLEVFKNSFQQTEVY